MITIDLSATQEQLLDVTQALIRFRFHLAGLLSGLKAEQEGGEPNPETDLRSDVECALVDNFDPMLRTLLAAAGGSPRAKLLEAALDLAGFRLRLQTFSEGLPRSPEEEAMLEGSIPADVATEMRTTINAILADQLDLALDNLLHAAGYRPPDEAARSGSAA
jgi:hypothetical protein